MERKSDMFYECNDLKDKEILLKLNHTCQEQPEKQWLPAYYFDICLLDGTVIGYCDLRIGHNEKTYIGYGINEEYRGHHYAAKACQLLFKQARKHDMDYIIITCVPENIASSITCEIAGGNYLETKAIPKNNEMYEEGKRFVKIFKFKI